MVNDYNVTVERYTNFKALCDTTDARAVNAWATNNRQNSGVWYGETFEEARQMLLYGDTASVSKLKAAAKVPPIATIKPRRINSPVGNTPRVPAAILGLPDSMKRRKPVNVKARVLTLLVNVDYNANVRPPEVLEHGRKLCAFIMAAEKAGYRIELDVLGNIARPDDSNAYFCRVNIKRASAPLDIKRVCYPLLHASMLRQIIFDWYERLPDAQEIFCYGRALTSWPKSQRARLLAHVLRPNERYIELMEDFTPDSILGHLEAR